MLRLPDDSRDQQPSPASLLETPNRPPPASPMPQGALPLCAPVGSPTLQQCPWPTATSSLLSRHHLRPCLGTFFSSQPPLYKGAFGSLSPLSRQAH